MARERGLYRRKDSRFWWNGLVLSDGRRVCQSTGCIDRTDAESYLVRLKLTVYLRVDGILTLAPPAWEMRRALVSKIERV